jgi:hypothetical protein
MTPDAFLRLLVPSLAEHFRGECYPDDIPVAGLAIEETTEHRSQVTVEGYDTETHTPFYATIRVHVLVPPHDDRATRRPREKP